MKYILPIFILLISHGAYAQSADDMPFSMGAALPKFYISSDSEGFKTQKIGVAAYPAFEHGNHYIGVGVTANHFAQNGWSRSGRQFSLVARDISTRSGMGYNVDVGFNTQGGHQIITTDSVWGKRWSEDTATELFINRDWVESQNSLINAISHTFAGGSIEQKMTPRVTAIGLLGGQHFSDGNMRQHARARLIYDVIPDYGITLQARLRAYHSNALDVNGNYFNPNRYSEEMLAIGVRHRVKNWVINGTAGLGMQQVDSASSTTTRLLEIGVTSPIAGNVFLRANGGYSQAAGFNGPSYASRYAQGELVFSY